MATCQIPYTHLMGRKKQILTRDYKPNSFPRAVQAAGHSFPVASFPTGQMYAVNWQPPICINTS